MSFSSFGRSRPRKNSLHQEGDNDEEVALLGYGGTDADIELLPIASIIPLSSAQQMKEKMKVIFNNSC
jgi:hypothetical protein